MTITAEQTGVAAVERAFARAHGENRCALITYLTAGYPSPDESLALISALQEGGADLIELGVPFSDPVADGPTIQRASQAALAAGVTPSACLELAARLRERGVTAPLVLMGYYNPIHSYGLDAYTRDCARMGVDGLIVPDLPPEEAGPLRALCRERGLALIFLVAPTTGEERLASIASATSGFLYVVSRLGITGSALDATGELAQRLGIIRAHARTPVAVGFGISRPEQMRALVPWVDGLIVGSAVVERAPDGPDALRGYVAELRAACVCGE
ncbi:MAG: tryptophan synthase subunit alpha [Chloroflexi bacterium]|nr:tryptophan synthase subunit alpha [Chloroflexota bacterium]